MNRMVMKEHKEVVSEAVVVEIEVEEVHVVPPVGVGILVKSKKRELIKLRNGHETEMMMDQIIIIARQKFLEVDVVVKEDEVIKEEVAAVVNNEMCLKMKTPGITKKIFEIATPKTKTVKIPFPLQNRYMRNLSRHTKRENKLKRIKILKIKMGIEEVAEMVKMILTGNPKEILVVGTVMMNMMTNMKMMEIIKGVIVTKRNLLSQNGKGQLVVVMDTQEEQIKVAGLITATRMSRTPGKFKEIHMKTI